MSDFLCNALSPFGVNWFCSKKLTVPFKGAVGCSPVSEDISPIEFCNLPTGRAEVSFPVEPVCVRFVGEACSAGGCSVSLKANGTMIGSSIGWYFVPLNNGKNAVEAAVKTKENKTFSIAAELDFRPGYNAENDTLLYTIVNNSSSQKSFLMVNRLLEQDTLGAVELFAGQADENFQQLIFSPDYAMVFAMQEKGIKAFDTRAHDMVYEIADTSRQNRQIALSSDGKYLFLLAEPFDGADVWATVYDGSNGKESYRFDLPFNSFDKAFLAGDGYDLAIVRGNALTIYYFSSGYKGSAGYALPESSFQSILSDPSGKKLFLLNNYFTVIDLAAMKTVYSKKTEGYSQLSQSADGKTIYLSGSYKKIAAFDADSLAMLWEEEMDFLNYGRRFIFDLGNGRLYLIKKDKNEAVLRIFGLDEKAILPAGSFFPPVNVSAAALRLPLPAKNIPSGR